MRRVRVVLFAGLLVGTLAAAPAGQSGCSCALPPPASGPAAPAPFPGHGVRQPADPGVRRNSPAPYAVGTPPPTVEPMTYRHAASGVTFQFEKDGQHVSAADAAGKELWRVNVIAAAHLKGREIDGKQVWPTISFAGPPTDWMVSATARRGRRGEYIAVGMNTKEGGLLDVRTGEYLFMGND